MEKKIYTGVGTLDIWGCPPVFLGKACALPGCTLLDHLCVRLSPWPAGRDHIPFIFLVLIVSSKHQ